MGRTLATMITISTYGTWLRGDRRGWVKDGIVYPANPVLEANDQERMKHEVFLFAADDLLRIGTALGESLVKRLDLRILALTVQVWQVHFVICATATAISDIVKCAKDAVRYALRPGRPI